MATVISEQETHLDELPEETGSVQPTRGSRPPGFLEILRGYADPKVRQRIRDETAHAAAARIDLETVLANYAIRFEQAKATLRAQHDVEKEAIEARQTAVLSELAVLSGEAAELVSGAPAPGHTAGAGEPTLLALRLARLEKEIETLEDEVSKLRLAEANAEAQLLAAYHEIESEAPLQSQRKQQELERNAHDHAKSMAEERERLADAERRTNADYWAKAIDDRESRLKANDGVLRAAQEESEVLLREGVTPKVARFLCWSTWLGVAGLGVVAGQLLAERLASLGDERVWQRLLGLVAGPESQEIGEGLLPMLGRYSLVLFSIAGLLAAAVVVTLVVLRWLDPLRTPARRAPRRTGRIDRLPLVRLVAGMPILILAGLLLFPWIVSTPREPAGLPASTAAATAISMLVGIALACLSAAGALLFAIRVLRPLRAGSKAGWVASLFYATLMLLPPLVLVGAAYFETSRLAILALGMMAGACAGVQGLAYAGVFEREQSAEREAEVLREELEAARRLPAAADYFRQPDIRKETRPSSAAPPSRLSDEYQSWLIERCHASPARVKALSNIREAFATARTERANAEAKLSRLRQSVQNTHQQRDWLWQEIKEVKRKLAELHEKYEGEVTSLEVLWQEVKLLVETSYEAIASKLSRAIAARA